MAHDWLLLETMGDEPVIVAQGRAPKSCVPLKVFLRRSPVLPEIEDGIAQLLRSRTGSSITLLDRLRAILIEPVRMTDGRTHGVQLWSGPQSATVPPRPLVGPLVWDLTSGSATATPASLAVNGRDPATELLAGRAFADDLPYKDLNPSETRVLTLAINGDPGDHVCTAWDATDHDGTAINVCFAARVIHEAMPDGGVHAVARAMNWRGEKPMSARNPAHPAQRILQSLARPGVYRALVDMNTWAVLKWLDDPCPLYDWRLNGSDLVHPDDQLLQQTVTDHIGAGRSIGVLRLKGYHGDWVPMHIRGNRVQLDGRTAAALFSVRKPTQAELAEAGLDS